MIRCSNSDDGEADGESVAPDVERMHRSVLGEAGLVASDDGMSKSVAARSKRFAETDKASFFFSYYGR